MNLDILQIRNDKITQFNKKGIYTIEDLVNFFPSKYCDFTSPDYIMYLEPDEVQSTIATISTINLTDKVLQIGVVDDKGWNMYINFFHMDYLAKQFSEGDRVLIGGTVKQGRFKTMFNPIVFTKDIENNMKIYPIYPPIKGMSSDYLTDKIKKAIQLMDKEDFLEPELQKKYGVVSNFQALKLLHYPKTMDDVKIAKKRMLFNDLFLFNYHMKKVMVNTKSDTHVRITNLEKTRELIKTLPYRMTEGNFEDGTFGQKDVLNDIVINMMDNKRVSALIQGDVGVGKTLVAVLLMTVLAENGYQSVIVAPTNILAKQHYNEISSFAEMLGFKVGFLSSEVKKSEQNKVIKAIKSGEIMMVVGTHAVFSDNVEYKNLGLTIVDEEHRFGVKQREKLNISGVHKISMSATPIPRSLAMSMYGDMVKVETINVAPKGRQKIDTELVLPSENNKVYYKILEELNKGRQAYIVCPLKNESDSDKLTDVVDIKEEYNAATAYFSKHGYKVGIVSGSTKASEVAKNQEVLNDFREHKYDVLIATTIIEVGVNVPNATIMLIKNAERFGFAQIHQLRGRVGRGNHKSYCYLMSDTKEKFVIFAQTTDGFKIAEEDLRLRGAGSFLGTEQSGNNKYLMLILANKKLNEYIKKDIDKIFQDKSRMNRYYNLIEIDEMSS